MIRSLGVKQGYQLAPILVLFIKTTATKVYIEDIQSSCFDITSIYLSLDKTGEARGNLKKLPTNMYDEGAMSIIKSFGTIQVKKTQRQDDYERISS